MVTEQLDFKVNEEWAKVERENPWASFIAEFAEDSSGQEFMRAKGRLVAYRISSEDKQGKQTYECAQCGGKVAGAKVCASNLGWPLPCFWFWSMSLRNSSLLF